MRILVIILLLFLRFITLTHANSKKNDSFRDEKIIKAQRVYRDKQIKGPFKHYGIKVVTDKGNEYLLHSTPKTGIVATQAKMSDKWKVKNDIPVNPSTIAQTMKAVHAVGNKFLNYLTGGTCIGSANKMESFLNRKKNK